MAEEYQISLCNGTQQSFYNEKQKVLVVITKLNNIVDKIRLHINTVYD